MTSNATLIRTLSRFFFLACAAFLLTACASLREPESFTSAFSTPEGNRIWVLRTVFDDSWGVPGGGVSCCWKAAGRGAINWQKLPEKVYVRWLQREEGITYEAEVMLTEDLDRLARDLTPYTVGHTGEERLRRNLIIGMLPEGEVVVWLSNAATDRNKTGRVIHEVGRAKARVYESETEG